MTSLDVMRGAGPALQGNWLFFCLGTTDSRENFLLAHEDMQCDHVGRQQRG